MFVYVEFIVLLSLQLKKPSINRRSINNLFHDVCEYKTRMILIINNRISFRLLALRFAYVASPKLY